MAQVNKIDSNITGLAYAAESYLGVLPGSPVWKRLEPNSYSDFGGNNTKVAPNPINPSRQRKKGVLTDLDSDGGFNHDLTFYNLQEMLESVFFANMRRKGQEIVTAVDEDGVGDDLYLVADTSLFQVGSLVKGFNFNSSANNGLNVVTAIDPDVSVGVADGSLVDEASPPANARVQVVGFEAETGDIDVVVSGDLPTLVSTNLDFTTLGLVVGQWVFVGGDVATSRFSNEVNNGFKRVRSISENALVFDKSVQTMVAETAGSQSIRIFFGDVLRNETGSQIVRKSFHLERTLGASDSSLPNEIQSEYLLGAIPNEFTLNVPSANLMNMDFNFAAINNLQRTSVQGPLQSDVQIPERADVYNTSSDFARIKMAVVTPGDAAPTPLFAFITEATISINNNLTANKAVGLLGAFDMTAGTFAISGNITAYFANVEAVQAVRNNDDVTIDMIVVKNNQGLVVDLPLIALGDGRLNVEQDQPITLPLSMDAATAEDIAPGMDHTALLTFFAYLPNEAE